MLRGIEIEAPMVRRDRRLSKAIVIPLSPAEAAFLLQRVANVSATAEAIVHHPAAGQMISPWTRHHVVEKIVYLRENLRRGPGALFVITALDRAILVDAFEHNPYFAAMGDDDPRLTADAVRQAERFRARAQAALAQPIRRVPLGQGRSRLADKQADQQADQQEVFA